MQRVDWTPLLKLEVINEIREKFKIKEQEIN